MQTCNSTDVRKDFGHFIDSVVRDKPRIIKRSRDYVCVSNIEMLKEILKAYKFTVNFFEEDDKSITASLNEFDIVVNGSDKEEAISLLATEMIEYAEEFYNDFNYWISAPNRKVHLPYVMRVLLEQNNLVAVKELIYYKEG